MDSQELAITTDLYMLALCIWREAQNQCFSAKVAQAWSVRNRVNHPSWWGKTWIDVITEPEQYSSFNSTDPNSRKWPRPNDVAWSQCWTVATAVYNATIADPTNGATHYFDESLDAHPPKWATDGSMERTYSIERFHFYKLVTK